MSLVVAAIVAIAILWIRRSSTPSTFLNGVYVNGVSLGGMSYADGYQKVKGLAAQRINENAIRVSCGEKEWTLTPSMLSASMDVESQLALAWNFGHTGSYAQKRSQQDYLKDHTAAFNSGLNYDEAKLDQFIAEIKAEIDIPPVDATILVGKNDKLTVTDSADGQAVDGNALREALSKVIVEGSAPEIQLVPQAVKPSIPSEELRKNTEQIAICTTTTKTSSSNRTWNIRRALAPFNGFAVHPGETISVNQVIGKRTVDNKFREAPEFAGTNVQMGVGGGVCQASSTLYKALLTAGMTVEERWQHNMKVSYIDPSLDATINNDDKDLVFTNNRDSTIYIYTSVNDEHAQVRIYGKRTEYKIVPVSEIIQKDIPAKSIRKKKDTSGKHAYYTDDKVLESEGKPGLRSRALLYYYDWNTGEQAKEPDELHVDYYFPLPPVYWVGVHEREDAALP